MRRFEVGARPTVHSAHCGPHPDLESGVQSTSARTYDAGSKVVRETDLEAASRCRASGPPEGGVWLTGRPNARVIAPEIPRVERVEQVDREPRPLSSGNGEVLGETEIHVLCCERVADTEERPRRWLEDVLHLTSIISVAKRLIGGELGKPGSECHNGAEEESPRDAHDAVRDNRVLLRIRRAPAREVGDRGIPRIEREEEVALAVVVERPGVRETAAPTGIHA